jgi:C-terminal processing protease CtpA/Prc
LFQSEIKSGNLNSLNEKDFAKNLTQKLRASTKDKHFLLNIWTITPLKILLTRKNGKSRTTSATVSRTSGFEKAERLEGNVGYINYKGFAELKSSRKTLEAAMNFVANTNSLIIDLRENGGGNNATFVEFCSYFSIKKKSYTLLISEIQGKR